MPHAKSAKNAKSPSFYTLRPLRTWRAALSSFSQRAQEFHAVELRSLRITDGPFFGQTLGHPQPRRFRAANRRTAGQSRFHGVTTLAVERMVKRARSL